jgi:hypothetical protein
MLRDVVVHIHNEQPITADLLNAPAPSDIALICSNLRTGNGKKPVFADKADSTFVIPLAHVRFIEINKASMEAAAAESEAAQAGLTCDRVVEDDGNLAPRGPLPRLTWLAGSDLEGGPTPTVGVERLGRGSNVGAPLADELDQELLRRIREA